MIFLEGIPNSKDGIHQKKDQSLTNQLKTKFFLLNRVKHGQKNRKFIEFYEKTLL